MTELLLWLPILYPSFLSRKISIVLVHARVVKTGRVDQPLYPKNILHLVYFVWRFCHINKWGKFQLKHSWIIHWNQTLIPSRKKRPKLRFHMWLLVVLLFFYSHSICTIRGSRITENGIAVGKRVDCQKNQLSIALFMWCRASSKNQKKKPYFIHLH